jgi:coproporphyrinogen III oxidase
MQSLLGARLWLPFARDTVSSNRSGAEGEGEIGFSMDGNIFNSQGVQVATVRGSSIFSLKGEKLYDLRGINIYKLSGVLVGHLANANASEKHLDKATDKLFPEG